MVGAGLRLKIWEIFFKARIGGSLGRLRPHLSHCLYHMLEIAGLGLKSFLKVLSKIRLYKEWQG